MKKLFSLLLAFILLIGIITPLSADAASKTYYYPVEGTSTLKPGIYKGTINGKGKAVYTEKVYKRKKMSKPPIKIKDVTFYEKGEPAKKSDFKKPYELITLPIHEVQKNGKDLYFTKFKYAGYYFNGLGTYVYEIYKRDSKGKIKKVVNDKVSFKTTQPFYVKGKYIYYAKVNKNLFADYTIVRATLDGKKKKTLKKAVEDFWVSGKYIYYVKNNTLYRMDTNGKKVKKYSNLKVKLNGDSLVDFQNYLVTFNGDKLHALIANDINNKSVYLDFSTGKTTEFATSTLYALDADVKKKRYIGVDWDESKQVFTIGMYDFNGKLIKKSKVTFDSPRILAVNAKKGEVIYLKGKNLKKLKF